MPVNQLPAFVQTFFVMEDGGGPIYTLAYFNGNIRFYCYGGVGLDFTSTNICTLNAWNDIAVQRFGSTWTIWVNGVGTSVISAQVLNSVPTLISLGRFFYGYVDHVRLSNTARFSLSGYVAPTGLYPAPDANTLL